MFEEGALDLFVLSRDLEAHEKGTSDARHLSSQKTFAALREKEPAAHDVLLRDALVRWVYELLQARVAGELTEDETRARSLPAEDKTPPRTFDEARLGLVFAAHRKAAASAWDRLVERGPTVAAPRAEKRARRFEAARRLGLAHPFALATDPVPVALARALLDATEALATDLRKRERRDVEGPFSAADAIRAALAPTAAEGWPAILGERWLREAFPALAMPARKTRFPEPVGGASFLRAAAQWGYALREGGTARSLPFALARDPYATAAHLFGAALAIAVADPVFQKRRLRLAARTGAAQSRALRLVLLHEARFAAMRLLLAAQERVSADDFEELGTRVFGAPLPAALRDAWPQARCDDSARFVAVLRAHTFVRELVSRHDEDWFENPRAGAELSQLASGPVFDATAPDDASPSRIARAFEEALA
jgi:hypothetical protein